MHLEHENNSHRLDETIDKILNPLSTKKATKRIAIVYPKKDELQKAINELKVNDIKLLETYEEVMIIFLGLYNNTDEKGYWHGSAIRKRYSTNGTKMKEYKFKMTTDGNDVIYSVY